MIKKRIRKRVKQSLLVHVGEYVVWSFARYKVNKIENTACLNYLGDWIPLKNFEGWKLEKDVLLQNQEKPKPKIRKRKRK